MADFSVNMNAGVCHITITRPTKRNTLDAQACITFVELLAQAQRDPEVRVVVLSGSDTIFCAGTDITENLQRTQATQAAFDAVIQALIAFDKPVLAAVRGPSLGIGVAMLYYCDIVYCGKKALFSMPFTALGLTPEYGLSKMVAQRAGFHKAAEKLFLSEPIDAMEAYDMGIVNGIVDDEKVLEETLSRAARLTTLPLGSLRATKALLRQSLAQELSGAFKNEQTTIADRLQSAEAQEACQAFQEGRKPDFSNIASE
ncbi:MAG: enoyl-CoA hydratase/isomerase family protein [Burkholderiaceae bacterium]|nr:enoyl-CoA hydratase/isomerase family protein [Burkholderiaceae bacterium]